MTNTFQPHSSLSSTTLIISRTPKDPITGGTGMQLKFFIIKKFNYKIKNRVIKVAQKFADKKVNFAVANADEFGHEMNENSFESSPDKVGIPYLWDHHNNTPSSTGVCSSQGG